MVRHVAERVRLQPLVARRDVPLREHGGNLGLRHRLPFLLRQVRHRSSRRSEIRVAIYGPAAITALARRAGELQHALPKQSFYAVHAEPKQFFEPADFSELLADPHIIGLHISPKGRGGETPIPGSLYAWAAEKFGK